MSKLREAMTLPDEVRIECSNCHQSIWLAEIDGHRVPIVVRVIAGQLPHTDPVDVNLDVAFPAVLRELLAMPTPRLNLCVPCFAALFDEPMEPPLAPVYEQGEQGTP